MSDRSQKVAHRWSHTLIFLFLVYPLLMGDIWTVLIWIVESIGNGAVLPSPEMSPAYFVWTVVSMGFLLSMAVKVMSKIFGIEVSADKLKHTILQKSVSELAMYLLCVALLEEFIFRWIPLAIVYTQMWHTALGFWFLVIASSVIFGLAHIFNQDDDTEKKIFPTLSQMMYGVVWGIVFLAHGFFAAVVIHFLHNMIICIAGKLSYKLAGRSI